MCSKNDNILMFPGIGSVKFIPTNQCNGLPVRKIFPWWHAKDQSFTEITENWKLFDVNHSFYLYAENVFNFVGANFHGFGKRSTILWILKFMDFHILHKK